MAELTKLEYPKELLTHDFDELQMAYYRKHCTEEQLGALIESNTMRRRLAWLEARFIELQHITVEHDAIVSPLRRSKWLVVSLFAFMMSLVPFLNFLWNVFFKHP
jgi:hypothetical protein